MKDIELYNGDCLEIMKDLENDSIDLVVVDPHMMFKHKVVGVQGAVQDVFKMKSHLEHLET